MFLRNLDKGTASADDPDCKESGAILARVRAGWALVKNWRSARFLVWVFALEGSIDLVNAIALAQLHGAAVFMGAAYWIPAFWVPALLVTHYITFVVLVGHWKDAGR